MRRRGAIPYPGKNGAATDAHRDMSSTALRSRAAATHAAVPLAQREAGYQAFLMLRLAFTVAPIAFGLDKFFNVLTDWPHYLAPWVNDIVPGSGQDFMYVVGGIEIVAGLIVAFAPRVGAFVVAGWLFGIIVNLLTNNAPEYYDIALRDVGLMLAALTFGRLALAVVPARKSGVLPDRPW
jgi:DoxX